MPYFIFCLFLSLGIFGQVDSNEIDFNHFFIHTFKSNDTASFISNGVEATFYPDSIPLKEWLKSTVFENFPIANYRVLSIYNAKSTPQRIYNYVFKTQTQTTLYYMDKIFIYLQAKDDRGNWCDIDDVETNTYKSKILKTQILPHETNDIAVKLPHGDYATKLRFKILTNSPPDNSTEQYMYSNIFSGTINKLLLK